MGVSAKYQIYRCTVCGNVVEVLQVGGGKLVCCGQEMELITENTVEASKEKHIPVVEKTAEGYSVKVGSVTHPMEEKTLYRMDRTDHRHFGVPQGAEAG